MKTFIPQLVKLLRAVCAYIIRYRTQIEVALGPNSAAALTNVVTACQALDVLAAAFLRDDVKYPTEANPFG